MPHTSVPATVVIPTGSSYAFFDIAAASPGTDVLIASAPGYTSVARNKTVSPGLIYSYETYGYYGPLAVATGDSAYVSFMVLAPSGNEDVAPIAATTFTIASSANIQFLSGGPTSKVITSFTMPAGVNYIALWIKGISAGTGSFTVTHPDYQPFAATIAVVKP